MENVLKLLAKCILMPLELTAAASTCSVQKKIFESRMTTLIISNEEMEDIMKIVQSLEDFCLLIKSVSKRSKNEKNNTKKNKMVHFLACY